jgi:hypothetical protein
MFRWTAENQIPGQTTIDQGLEEIQKYKTRKKREKVEQIQKKDDGGEDPHEYKSVADSMPREVAPVLDTFTKPKKQSAVESFYKDGEKKKKGGGRKPKNSFDYEGQREYDYEDLERSLQSRMREDNDK